MRQEALLLTIGKRIRQIRTYKRIKQKDLAELCKFEKASMSRIEAGKSNITMATLLSISAALETNIYELVKNPDQNVVSTSN